MVFLTLYIIFSFLQHFNVGGLSHTDENDSIYWNEMASNTLTNHVNNWSNKKNDQPARSVILIIGSGMSLTTIKAADIMKGYKDKTKNTIHFESFPVTALIKSQCADGVVADDTCSATSYSGGFKGKMGKVGISPDNVEKSCNRNVNRMKSIADWALSKGKDVGIVTTGTVTDAAVASLYAYGFNASWEADVDIPSHKISCLDFAYQLIHKEPGKRFKVILGGGHSNFISDFGRRNDERNLINDWIADKVRNNFKYGYVNNAIKLKHIGNVDYLLGLFTPMEMNFHYLADDSQPSLQNMMKAAVKVLSKNKHGYLLFVFANNINKAHEENKARMALYETIELSKSVGEISDMVDDNNTLTIVTANHGSTMTVRMDCQRWYNITGQIQDCMNDQYNVTTPLLAYANGPGYSMHYGIKDDKLVAFKNLDAPDSMYPSVINLEKGTSGGEDVPLFVKGPQQHIFTGTYSLDLIPHMIGYAACIGPGEHICKSSSLKIQQPLLTANIVFIMIYIIYNP